MDSSEDAEDDADDTEMADYETDDHDDDANYEEDENDVDTINNAKARPQQRFFEIRSRRSFAGDPPKLTLKLKLKLTLTLTLTLTLVEECSNPPDAITARA